MPPRLTDSEITEMERRPSLGRLIVRIRRAALACDEAQSIALAQGARIAALESAPAELTDATEEALTSLIGRPVDDTNRQAAAERLSQALARAREAIG